MADLRTSHPASDAWRPNGDRLSWSDAGWLGVAWAIATHATLHFFSAAIRELEPLLVVFAPAEQIAFAVTTQAAPLARWAVLLVVIAFYGALVGWGTLAGVHEVGSLVRGRRKREAAPGSNAETA